MLQGIIMLVFMFFKSVGFSKDFLFYCVWIYRQCLKHQKILTTGKPVDYCFLKSLGITSDWHGAGQPATRHAGTP